MPTTHVFESPHGDGADETQVRPSNWNDDHDVDLSDYTGDVGSDLTPAGSGYFSGTVYATGVERDGGTLNLTGTAVGLYAGDSELFWSTAALYANDAGKNIGTAASPWQHGYFSGTVYAGQVIRDDGSALRLVSTGGALEFRPTNTLAFAMTTGNFRPTSPGTELGRSADPFSNGYFSGTVYTSDIVATGLIRPDGDLAASLGNSVNRFNNVFASSFYAYNLRSTSTVIQVLNTLRPDADGTLDFATTDYRWKDGYFSGHLYAQGAYFDAGDDVATIELQRDKGSAVLAGEQLGAISYMGHDGTALVQGAEMRAVPSADWSATSHPTRILFSTTDVDETVATPRVRIDEHGDMTPHGPGVGEDGTALGTAAVPWAQGWFSGTVTAAAFNPPVDVMATLRAETDTPILDYLAAGTPNPHQTKGAIIALLLLVRTLMNIED